MRKGMCVHINFNCQKKFIHPQQKINKTKNKYPEIETRSAVFVAKETLGKMLATEMVDGFELFSITSV